MNTNSDSNTQDKNQYNADSSNYVTAWDSNFNIGCQNIKIYKYLLWKSFNKSTKNTTL